MVAAPQYGQMVFVGVLTSITYNKDVYLGDVAEGLLRFDAGGGAGAASPQDWLAPEPMLLTDFAVVTGLTDTSKIQMTRNGVPTGDMLRYTIHLTSLNNRPSLRIPFRRGDRISAIQKA